MSMSLGFNECLEQWQGYYCDTADRAIGTKPVCALVSEAQDQFADALKRFSVELYRQTGDTHAVYEQVQMMANGAADRALRELAKEIYPDAIGAEG